MQKKLLVLFIPLLILGCYHQRPAHDKTVAEYYKAFDSGNYGAIQVLINDTITIISGDYVTPYTHESYYEFFKWDSIFQPTYKVVELKEKNSQVIATIASKSKRYAFLKNNPLTCKFIVSFDSGKISKIESLDCPDADWDIWQKERDSLVRWIEKNHPELDGFIYDMTMDGATNYVKAIELYKK